MGIIPKRAISIAPKQTGFLRKTDTGRVREPPYRYHPKAWDFHRPKQTGFHCKTDTGRVRELPYRYHPKA